MSHQYQPTPPSYDQSQSGFSNAHYMGPNPTYPNAGPEPYKNMGPPYPPAGVQPYPPTGAQPYPETQSYPGAQPYPEGQPYPVQTQPTFVTATQYPGTSVHMVSPPIASIPVNVVTPHILGPYPTTVVCRNCNEQVTTEVRTETGMLAWISCGVLVLFGCIFGCCLIPFCMDSCKDSYHSCPRCNAFIGKYSKMR